MHKAKSNKRNSKTELIKIFAAYPWNINWNNKLENKILKNKFSPMAIKEIINRVQKRLTTFELNNPDTAHPKIFYSRLRSTSGTFVLSSIRERMASSYAIIFDITENNPNVMLELGIALELQKSIKNSARVFLIACAEEYSDSLLPSDIRGYFLTTYRIDEQTNTVIFGDNGSLVMRIVSDILEKTQHSFIENADYE